MVEALLEQQAPWLLTPTFLFLLLNIVIATIFLSSAFNRRLKHPLPTTPPPPLQPQLAHTPSLFSRVTSFNFSNYYPDHHKHTNSAPSFFYDEGAETMTQEENVEPEPEAKPKPSLFTRVASFNFPGWASEEPGSKPETKPKPKPEGVSSSRRVAREPYLLSRIASFGSLRKRVEEIGEVNTHSNANNKVNIKKAEKKKEEAISTTTTNNNNTKKKEKKKKEEEEVDAKADDFISRFKQQLKIQRAESLLRYKSA